MIRLTPRWYQQEACDKLTDALLTAKNVNPIAAIVTGGGKALLNAMLIETLLEQQPGVRILSLAPSMELVRQNVDEAAAYWYPDMTARLGVYCAGLNRKDRLAQITFGTPQSVTRAISRFGHVDYVLVDEAHTFNLQQKTARNIVDVVRQANPQAQFAGFTATDFVMQGLKVVPLTQCGLFNHRAYDLTSGRNFNRLVREGYLSPVVAPAIRFPQIDLSEVNTRNGEFDEAEVAKRAMAVTRECVHVALENAPSRRHFMWFAVNIEHAQMIWHALSELGESAVIIHGNLDKSERITGISAYLSKQHRHIVSVAMLTTGFNAKFVDCIVCLRPTQSLVLWRQIVGRGLRPYLDKENILILDAGGNFARHGPINREISAGDSRAGMWECTTQAVEAPLFRDELGDVIKLPVRETSAIRFPINHPTQPEHDLRVTLGLMAADTAACGFLNDPEHMVCRQCGRPRQGFLTPRKRRLETTRDIGSDDSYEIHDEDSIVLRDEVCTQTRTLPVLSMHITTFGQSVLEFAFETEFGTYNLRLDFDRQSASNKFYAQARKFFERATGRRAPHEGYRVVLQKTLIPPPVDITLTKHEDDKVFITEVRFLRDGHLESFRYDPDF